MKLNLIAVSSVLAVALAQESSTTTAAPTQSLTPQERCAEQCGDSDLCCKAQCYNVPCPSEQMANDTTSCVADCDQGDGSPADTEAYAACQQRCYTTHFFPATVTVTDAPSGTNTGASTATTTGDSDSGSDSGGSDSGDSESGTPTDGAAPTTTPNAATMTQLKVGVSAAGLAGFLLATWAL